MAIFIDDKLLESVGCSKDSEIRELSLDFKQIEMIDNLWKFKSLVKLNLQNNRIKKIEGLSCLIQLKHLDLSYNSITEIEGLECLLNLNVLSLYTNCIKRLQAMDSLANLQILSVGKNCIENLEDLEYLRKFKCLRTLTFEGNPLSRTISWLQILVRLPNLQILDHKLVDADSVELARAKHGTEIANLEEAEKQVKLAAEEKDAEVAEIALYQGAFISDWKDGVFVNRLLQSGCSVENPVLTQEFETEVKDALGSLNEQAIQAFQNRTRKVKNFKSGMELGNANTKNKLIQGVQELENMIGVKQIKKIDKYSQELVHQIMQEVEREPLKTDVLRKVNELITLEIKRSEYVEDSIVEFRSKIEEIHDIFHGALVKAFAELKVKYKAMLPLELETAERQDLNEGQEIQDSNMLWTKTLDVEVEKIQQEYVIWLSNVVEQLSEGDRCQHRNNLFYIAQNAGIYTDSQLFFRNAFHSVSTGMFK